MLIAESKKLRSIAAEVRARTGTVAAGVLLALGQAKTIDEAESKAKSIRNVIDIKPTQKDSGTR